MELVLYCSVSQGDTPTLVGLQNEGFRALPTVLVCPLREGLNLTALRVEVAWAGQKMVACPELTRPIRRTALRPVGTLGMEASREIMQRLQMLLAE